MIGSYHLDDPEGRVGMEGHLVRADDVVLHVPLTYRDAPLAGAGDGLVGTMEHSALGARWVYDGLRDPCFVRVLAATAMTGQGEALGLVSVDGRWYVAPSKVRIHGGGWSGGTAPVDGLVLEHDDASGARFGGDRFDLIVHRHTQLDSPPAIGLVATWDEQPTPLSLVAVLPR